MIKENIEKILSELPEGVTLVGAAKNRTPEEIQEAVDAGVKIIGENYVQEAEKKKSKIKNLPTKVGIPTALKEDVGKISKLNVQWHLIGPLQRNKAKKAVEIFNMIETVDSVGIAEEIDKRCRAISKVMPVLIEINSGREEEKAGIFPEDAIDLVKGISNLPNIKIMGLMTMGPRFGNPEDSRPYFIETRKIFEKIKSLNLPNVEMKYLSMGMTNSYKIAIGEGANMVRIGTLIFGERD